MHDFDAFLRECYDREGEGEHVCTWLDIRARFRVWSRCTDAFRDDLAAHLRDCGHAFDAESQTYGGLRMKPLPAAHDDDDMTWVLRQQPRRSPSMARDLREAFLESDAKDRRVASLDIARSAMISRYYNRRSFDCPAVAVTASSRPASVDPPGAADQ